MIPDFLEGNTTNDDIVNAWNTQKFSVAHGHASHVEGHDNLSLGRYSHTEGLYTVAIGSQSHTGGYYTKALHDNEAAYGKYNESNDDTLFSVGDGTADDARHNAFEITTTGGKLHDKDIATTDLIYPMDDTLSNSSRNPVQNKVIKQAIDNKADKTVATTEADGLMSASDKTKLDNADDIYALKSKYGDMTINVGRMTGTDVGICSDAEGWHTTASGDYSHTEGLATTASNRCSHAEGVSTVASGEYSHAEGVGAVAFGNYSHARGYNTIANNSCETASGKYNVSNSDTLFSIGDGTADDARHNAFEITTTGGKLHDKDIATTNNISNINLLTNPDFSINQRGISGAFSDTGKYFVDRWRLVSGTVTVNSDGTLTLDGSICQPLENYVGTNVTASVSAGTAVYDDTAKTFTITGNGDVISWAKLETGSAATDFSPPDPAAELMKCYRYFYRVGRGIANPNQTVNMKRIDYQNISEKTAGVTLRLPVEMRVSPTVTISGTPWCFRLFTNNRVNAFVANSNNIIISTQKFGYEIVITNNYFANATDGFIAPVYTTGYTDFDAEIY